MGKSLKQRLEEEGITKEEMAHAIRLRGLLPIADERGCGIESITKYAREELGITNAPLVNKNTIKPNLVLAEEFIFAMYQKWQSIKAEIKQEGVAVTSHPKGGRNID